MIKSKKKILMLSMSCNQPYYQTLLATVKDTWAKPVIQGKYEGINWFGYTSCDKHHPNECIDWDEHMIYVDCPDGIDSSYIKTQKAYHLIKEHVEFDYIVRTNCSVFVNIENMIKHINEFKTDNHIMSNTMVLFDDDKKFITYCFLGMFIGMRREFFEIGMLREDGITSVPAKVEKKIISTDDAVMSWKIYNYVIKYKKIHIKGENMNPSGKFPLYKPYREGIDNFDNLLRRQAKSNFIITTNPEIINDNVVVRVRTFHDGVDRIEKGYESEHMYELYNVLKR